MNRKGLYILLYEENTLKTCSIIHMDFVLLWKTDLSPLNKVLNEKGWQHLNGLSIGITINHLIKKFEPKQKVSFSVDLAEIC